MFRDQLADALGGPLRARGFLRRGGGMTWRREREHGIEVFNIQASRWNEIKFYLNVGVYQGDDLMLRWPLESQCQIRSRIAHEGSSVAAILDTVLAWFDDQAQRLADLRPAVTPLPPVRVTHATFGEGTVVAEREGVVGVVFDDGVRRRVARRFLGVVGTA